MNILAFSDLHGSEEALNVLLRKAEKADIIVCAGDISNWGRDIDIMLKKLKKPRLLMLLIPGNHEFDEELREACSKFEYALDIHRAHYEIDGYVFFGYGGGGFALESKEFERLGARFIKNIKNREEKKIVLVTHGPPYGTKVDFIPGLGHRGCQSVRKFIEQYQPTVSICGHLHETSSLKDKIRKTLIVNPGPYGKIIKI